MDENLRRKYERPFAAFMQAPHADEILRVLRRYVRIALPAFRRSELSFWAVSCLSGPAVRSRVNLFWQEVCTVFVDDTGELWFDFQVAMQPFDRLGDRGIDGFLDRYPECDWVEHYYESGGQDQIRVQCPASRVDELLSDADFIPSLRELNLRLMRKGATVFNRYHCFPLADRLLD